MGSSASVFKMSMSRVPWTRSLGLSAIDAFPLRFRRKNTPVCRDDPVDICSGEQPAAHEHGGNAAQVVYVRQRISFEQHEIGALADLDRALRFLSSEKFRGVDRRRLNRLERGKPGIGHQLQLVVKAEAGHQTIATCQEAAAPRMQVVDSSQAGLAEVPDRQQCLFIKLRSFRVLARELEKCIAGVFSVGQGLARERLRQGSKEGHRWCLPYALGRKFVEPRLTADRAVGSFRRTLGEDAEVCEMLDTLDSRVGRLFD